MFIGHVNELQPGHWKTLAHYNSTKVLINNAGCYQIQNNICPHQGSRIRAGNGVAANPVCPYHGWSWTKDGVPQGNGTVGHSLGTTACTNQHPLTTKPASNWSGFLFDCNIPLDLDISGNYQLVEYRQDHINASYIPIMDLFLDIDHIPLVHPKLYDLIDVPDVKNVSWQTWENGSIQLVTGRNNTSGDIIRESDRRKQPYNAAWLAVYPYTMFEWQPGAVFVMVNEPISSNETVAHVYKYQDLDYESKQWAINSQVWETAWQQDKEQAERLEPGWSTTPTDHLDNEKIRYRNWITSHK